MNDLRLISLNLWGGYVLDPLLDFLESHKHVEVFCFQELYHNAAHEVSTDGKKLTLDLMARIIKILSEHRPFFRPVLNNSYGIGTFVKKTITILEESEILIHENPNYIGRGPTHSRNMQLLTLNSNNSTFNIANVHGLWNGLGKGDSQERIIQATKIKTTLSSVDNPLVLCGDFNLNPDTKSIDIIKEGMRDLISENNVKSTRTSLYTKENKFADYIFTNHKIQVLEFSILTNIVSDHAPLYIRFSF
jgi:endonuclease/exonuclease/phosphatase family metal-dependent hydrolase